MQKGCAQPARSVPHVSYLSRTLSVAALASLIAAAGCDRSPVASGTGASLSPGGQTGPAYLHAPAAGSRVVPNRYMVRFRDDVADVPGLARALGVSYGDSVHFVFQHAIRGFSLTVKPGRLEALLRIPQVQDVEPVVIGWPDAVQDPAPAHLDRIDQRGRPLDNVYEYFHDGSGVNLYVIDTGIRSGHVEFAGRSGVQWRAVGNDPTGAQDCDGHGTAVASAAGGTTYGAAKRVTLHTVKIVFACEPDPYSDYAVAGLDFVTVNHRKPAVANMSFGFPRSTMIDDATRRVIAAGVSFVTSAGNTDTDACQVSPKSVLNTIVVGATNFGDARLTSSNWGACVNLFAPGEDVLVADAASTTGVRAVTGTSISAPQAAGVAALLLQQDPSITPSRMKTLLENGATQGVVSGDLKGTPNRLLYSKLSP